MKPHKHDSLVEIDISSIERQINSTKSMEWQQHRATESIIVCPAVGVAKKESGKKPRYLTEREGSHEMQGNHGYQKRHSQGHVGTREEIRPIEGRDEESTTETGSRCMCMLWSDAETAIDPTRKTFRQKEPHIPVVRQLCHSSWLGYTGC